MKLRFAIVLLCLSISVWAKNTMEVKVVTSHQVTHEQRDSRAIVTTGILGAHAPREQAESFNLDAVIGEEHVVLACDDPKGCENVAAGTYQGEMKRSKWIRLTFTLPVTHKEVTRWYKMAGSW